MNGMEEQIATNNSGNIEPLNDIAVFETNAGPYDGADIVFSFNGILISVSVFPSSSERHSRVKHDIEDDVLDLITRGTSLGANDEEIDEMQEEVLNIILGAARSILKEATVGKAPPDHATNRKCLHSQLYPDTFTFRLTETSGGKPTLIPISPEEAYTTPRLVAAHYDVYEPECDDESLPQYSSKDIFVLDNFLRGANTAVCTAEVDGKVVFCKAHGRSGFAGSSVGRELQCLQDIRQARQLDQSKLARIPLLLGYIKHSDTGRIIGFIRQWMPGMHLQEVDVASIEFQTRQKWSTQIGETIADLHAMNLIWGDGKPHNIIIDENENAWLIDFGGGYTGGWVDGNLADTAEGDEQALGKIVRFLGLQDSFRLP